MKLSLLGSSRIFREYKCLLCIKKVHDPSRLPLDTTDDIQTTAEKHIIANRRSDLAKVFYDFILFHQILTSLRADIYSISIC